MGLARKYKSEELGYLIDADFYTENITEISNVNSSLDRIQPRSRKLLPMVYHGGAATVS